MNRYNAQILNDKGEYHLQFETDNRENFDAMEKLAQKIMDKKPRTNYDKITSSVESLAEFLQHTMDCSKCCVFSNYWECEAVGNRVCKDCVKEWLQKECENG